MALPHGVLDYKTRANQIASKLDSRLMKKI